LIAVPACASLWARSGRYKKTALGVTAVAFFLNGDLPWEIYQIGMRHLHQPLVGFQSQLALAGLMLPVPLMLFATGLFFLRVYAQIGNEIS
jgi:uncharacterized membrane protein YccC